MLLVSTFVYISHAEVDEEEGDKDLSSDELRGLHEKFDLNGDGKVSMPELLEYTKKAHGILGQKDITSVIEKIDVNKDDKLSLEELLPGWDASPDESLNKKMFIAADANADGDLDEKELFNLLYPEAHSSVLPLQATSAIKKKDLSGDGKLSLLEFAETSDRGTVSETERTDFNHLDKDEDGYLDHNELKDWISGQYHAEKAVMQVFDSADGDNDGHISADDLIAARERLQDVSVRHSLIAWARHREL